MKQNKDAVLQVKGVYVLAMVAGMILCGCHKDSFLDKKPNSDNVIPSTLSDFQALLDNSAVMVGTPVLGELSADNYWLTYSYWQSLDLKEHNAYSWAADIFGGQGVVLDWNQPYQQVFYANVVLDGLSKLVKDSVNQDSTWRAEKGQALFTRAFAFFNVAQIFAKPYDSSTASGDLGIPLRLSPDVNAKSERGTVQGTYAQILNDLLAAVALLPGAPDSLNPNRPTRPAACALLARVYLSMRAYTQAGAYADNCLQGFSKLLDFSNTDDVPNIGGAFPFAVTNKEIMYQNNFISTSPQILLGLVSPSVTIDSAFYASYDTNDLRRRAFYRMNATTGLPYIKGGYNGNFAPFSGLATDEVLLVRAECRARAGQTGPAMDDLNMLLSKRWAAGTYSPMTAANAGIALDSILSHRRKELPFRGVRWMDLRRLNKEGRNITPIRVLNGTTYRLLPNSNLYELPIPPDVLALSGMPNNPRP